MRHLKTLFVGQNFLEEEVCPSTNLYAVDLLSKSKPAEGTVISTYRQTAGRGQIGSKWESAPDKNVSLSIIFYPFFIPVHRQFDLNIAVSLALADVIKTNLSVADIAESFVKIKWPNDLYLGKKKTAGILIQNALSGKHLQSSVIGIGLNVNQKEFTSDAPNPTSLQLLTGKEYKLSEVVWEICAAVEARYLQLKAGKRLMQRAEYLTSFYQMGKVATYQRTNGTYFTGIIRGISDLGKLEIETETGQEEFALKEVKFM